MRKVGLAILGACVLTAVVTTIVVREQIGERPDDRHALAESLRSAVLNESRELSVSLPESYARETTRRYPVLYVLDGSSQATHTAESARLLARIGVMPEVLVVGIPSSSENRARDYTPPAMRLDDEKSADEKKATAGRADQFLRFLESELIPHVERHYRTTPVRMLAGNSRGGLFVVYSLLERPDLFRARFAFSPALWRDDDRLVMELAKSLKARGAGTPSFLYLSLGDGENEKMTRAFRKTAQVLSAAPASLRWRADITRGARHGDNAVLSTPVALHEYFRNTER